MSHYSNVYININKDITAKILEFLNRMINYKQLKALSQETNLLMQFMFYPHLHSHEFSEETQGDQGVALDSIVRLEKNEEQVEVVHLQNKNRKIRNHYLLILQCFFHLRSVVIKKS